MLLLKHLIDESMLNVDAAGIGAVQIAHELFEGRWILKWIHFQDFQ